MPTRTTELPARLRTPGELQRWALRCHAAGMSIGMVPTMGALHAGHESLMARARTENDRVVVSIFVNPAQFGPNDDYEHYPRDLAADLEVLAEAGVHAAFLPSVEAMYPDGLATQVHVAGPAGADLEAAVRPGHFDGVALVVAKLLIAGRPDRAYFGQKDAQQCAIVSRLARDLDTGVQIIICPTVRDADGLALSSRNAYLSADERVRARAIPGALGAAARAFAAGERRSAQLVAVVDEALRGATARVDYIAVVDPDSFVQVDVAAVGCQILVAARIGTTRLLDVLRLGMDGAPHVKGAGAT